MKGSTVLFKVKTFPTIKPKKIHKKAEEINKLLDDKNLFKKADKKTNPVTKKMPEIFFLIKCI